MKLYPAIDIKNGQCVRLRKGVFDDKTVYCDEPYLMAVEFEKSGADFLHIVDLDGARSGIGTNDEALEKIIKNITIPAEIGGGIRSMNDIQSRLELGFARVILGTAAVSNPDFVKEAVEEFGPEKIVVGIDAKDGLAAIKGWEEVSSVDAVSLALAMKKVGVKYIIYTDISKDGMLEGPNTDYTERLVRETGLSVIASGGVSSIDDLKKVERTGASGVVFGKAIYENKLDLKEAVALFKKEV